MIKLSVLVIVGLVLQYGQAQDCSRLNAAIQPQDFNTNPDSAIEVKWTVDFNQITEAEFIRVCLPNMRLNVKKAVSNQVVTETKPYYNQLTKGFQRFDNLSPVASYMIALVYTQSQSRFDLASVNASTCYSKPGAPKSLKMKVQSAGGSLVMSWTRPDVVKAPKVCYYEVNVVTRSESKYFKVSAESYEEKDKSLLQHMRMFRVRAVNANSFKNNACYANLAARCDYESASEYMSMNAPKDVLDALQGGTTNDGDSSDFNGSNSVQVLKFMSIALTIVVSVFIF